MAYQFFYDPHPGLHYEPEPDDYAPDAPVPLADAPVELLHRGLRPEDVQTALDAWALDHVDEDGEHPDAIPQADLDDISDMLWAVAVAEGRLKPRYPVVDPWALEAGSTYPPEEPF